MAKKDAALRSSLITFLQKTSKAATKAADNNKMATTCVVIHLASDPGNDDFGLCRFRDLQKGFMKHRMMLLVCLGLLTGRANADLIATTNSLPVDYTITTPISYFSGLVVFGGFKVTSFSTNVLPPASIPGTSINISYSATVTMSNLLNQYASPLTATELITFTGETNLVSTYDVEMQQMNIAGGNLPAGVMIRESPTLASTGNFTITALGNGFYQLHGYFDLYTEISFNGGANWFPNDGGFEQLIIAPEPSSAALFVLGMGGFACLRRPKK